MTTGKVIALTRWTFVGKVTSLLFNMLSRLVIIFLPRSKRLLVSWLQSPSAVILEPPKIKSATVSTVSPSIYHEVMGLEAMIGSKKWFSLTKDVNLLVLVSNFKVLPQKTANLHLLAVSKNLFYPNLARVQNFIF